MIVGDAITAAPPTQDLGDAVTFSSECDMFDGMYDGSESTITVYVPAASTASPATFLHEAVSVSYSQATFVGHDAFSYAPYLREVHMPSCTSVGSEAFCYCGSLSTLDMPNLQTVGTSAFYGCESLTEIDVTNIEDIYDYGLGVSPAVPINSPYALWPNLRGVGFYGLAGRCPAAVSMPMCVGLASGAFDGSPIERLYLMGSSMCYVDDGTFAGCDSLSAVYVPQSMYSQYASDSYWSEYWSSLLRPL